MDLSSLHCLLELYASSIGCHPIFHPARVTVVSWLPGALCASSWFARYKHFTTHLVFLIRKLQTSSCQKVIPLLVGSSHTNRMIEPMLSENLIFILILRT